MPRSRHKLPRRCVAAMLCAAATPAFAANQIYVGPDGGQWSDPAVWSTGSTPGNADNVFQTQAAAGPITLTYDTTAFVNNLAQNVVDSAGGGLLTFLQTANAFSTTTEYVGVDGLGAIIVQGGIHTISGAGSNGLFVGYNAGADGTFTLNGGTLNVTDSAYIGVGGSGTFNHNAGFHNINSYLVLGGDPSGTATTGVGTYNLGGPFGGGQLSVNTVYVGLSGSGVFNQSNGFFNPGGITVGCLPGSSGVMNMSGGGAYAGNAVIIGRHGSGQLNISGGSQTYASLVLGDNPDGVGATLLSGGALTIIGPELIGNNGVGAVIQTDGVHQAQYDLYLAVHGGSAATMDLSNNAVLQVPQTLNNGFPYGGHEYIGYNGAASVTQSGGTHIIEASLVLGRQSGGSGTYMLSGGTSAPRNRASDTQVPAAMSLISPAARTPPVIISPSAIKAALPAPISSPTAFSTPAFSLRHGAASAPLTSPAAPLTSTPCTSLTNPAPRARSISPMEISTSPARNMSGSAARALSTRVAATTPSPTCTSERRRVASRL